MKLIFVNSDRQYTSTCPRQPQKSEVGDRCKTNRFSANATFKKVAAKLLWRNDDEFITEARVSVVCKKEVNLFLVFVMLLVIVQDNAGD